MELPDMRAVHALLYNDRMDVFRTNSDPNEYGIIEQERKQVMFFEPCKLSFFTGSREDNPADDYVYYRRANTVTKIFCDPGLKFKAGDKIKVYRKRQDSDEYELFFEGVTNKPSVLNSHQEVELSEKEVN